MVRVRNILYVYIYIYIEEIRLAIGIVMKEKKSSGAQPQAGVTVEGGLSCANIYIYDKKKPICTFI